MLFVLLMCCAILILNKFLFNELDKFEFITFPYFKKEPSMLMLSLQILRLSFLIS